MENNGIGKLFEGVDRWTVLIYVLIVLVGFVAILSASYEEGAESIFSFSHFYMKQLVWMGISFAVAVVVLLVDASIYHKWAYLFYDRYARYRSRSPGYHYLYDDSRQRLRAAGK